MLIRSPAEITIAEDAATLTAASLPRQIDRIGRPTMIAKAEVPASAGLHPRAVALGLGGFGLFLAASWLGWGSGETAPLVAMVTLVFLVYFGLLVGLGRDAARHRAIAADAHRPLGFSRFLADRVDTCTGFLSGRAALIQIAFTPLLLGGLMTVFAIIWPLSH